MRASLPYEKSTGVEMSAWKLASALAVVLVLTTSACSGEAASRDATSASSRPVAETLPSISESPAVPSETLVQFRSFCTSRLPIVSKLLMDDALKSGAEVDGLLTQVGESSDYSTFASPLTDYAELLSWLQAAVGRAELDPVLSITAGKTLLGVLTVSEWLESWEMGTGEKPPTSPSRLGSSFRIACGSL